MDTLHDRLAELADDAPTAGAPAAELWARGKRAHRRRAAALAAATLLVVGAVGTGIGARLADRDRSGPAPTTTVGIALPIEYPAGEELPDLGDTPGPLAAIWFAPRVGGGAPEAVGLVAETGTFGTLPIDLRPDDPEAPEDVAVALSPDGRRIAYASPTSEVSVIVHDLVSGENDSPAIETRRGYTWIDATHLLGLVAGGTDADGWLWEPGTSTPKLVNPYFVPYGGTDLSVYDKGGGPSQCTPPVLQNVETVKENWGQGSAGQFEVPVLCDVLGIVSGSEILIGHWNSQRMPGDWGQPNDGNGTLVALDFRGGDAPYEDPALRRRVATVVAPERVVFAADLIGAALDADGGAS